MIARTIRSRRTPLLAALVIMATLPACAGLQNLIQPPVLELASGRESQVRLLGPSVTRPLGGAQLRVWTRIQNPNSFGFTLTRLAGDILLDDQRAADLDLPLGLPLQAAADTVIPIDVNISFADVPALADRLASALRRGSVDYALHGTLAVDAGAFGEPTFGPTTWVAGEVAVTR